MDKTWMKNIFKYHDGNFLENTFMEIVHPFVALYKIFKLVNSKQYIPFCHHRMLCVLSIPYKPIPVHLSRWGGSGGIPSSSSRPWGASWSGLDWRWVKDNPFSSWHSQHTGNVNLSRVFYLSVQSCMVVHNETTTNTTWDRYFTRFLHKVLDRAIGTVRDSAAPTNTQVK